MSERFGPWHLESLIAVGGLGEVWRAARGNQVVALKRLHSHLARNDAVRAQFSVEQRLATELPRHPNVVHAVDAGSVEHRPYVALELAPGEDLRRILAPPQVEPAAERGASSVARAVTVVLPRARVLAIAIAAAEGAAHLHRHGFVHGDINPGNLVVSTIGARPRPAARPDGGAVPSTTHHVTLVDLGIARPIGDAGVVRGTHAYMAPEQVRGEPWTPATDVFALGVVLWELITGARLFHRGPPWLSMAAVVEAAVPALADPAIDAVAQAALIKDPAARLASAAELAARLRAL
jgi:eukaryotic-like serine/threonine-protein kinase